MFSHVGTPEPPQTAPGGLAIATLVLGILALVLCPLLVGGIFGLAGLCLGFLHLVRRGPSRTMALWGAGLSLLGVLGSGAAGALYYYGYRQMSAQFASHDTDDEVTTDWQGLLAPAMTLTTLDGERLDLGALKGRPVVLNFWATWCGACQEELPHLNRLAQEHSDVVVIGVSDEPEGTLRAFVKAHPVEYRLVSARAPAPFDDIRSIPTSVFIDRKGVIKGAHVGYQDFDALKAHAMGADYDGQARVDSTPPGSGLTEANPALTATERWSAAVADDSSLATCRWDADDAPELLVAHAKGGLRVFDGAGQEKEAVDTPAAGRIECAPFGDGSVRLLGYETWGREVLVFDKTGRTLWSYETPTGVDGAHWGDLDGDGLPEMVVGLNGDGGLHAVSSDGRTLWTTKEIGNVWTQAIVPATPNLGSVVVVTEAGGSVHLYDSKGAETGDLRPLGDYFAPVDAAMVDGRGTVQILAAGRKRVVAFDTKGEVKWQVPTRVRTRPWRSTFLTHGDLTGDGVADWVFPGKPGALVVASASGERLGEVSVPEGASFVVLPAATGRGSLVTLAGGTLRAFTFD
jgi:thiol-disulfide isomerase/thioredoxin